MNELMAIIIATAGVLIPTACLYFGLDYAYKKADRERYEDADDSDLGNELVPEWLRNAY